MKHFFWLSDPHLNRVGLVEKYKLISNLRKESPDAIFISGDISSGPNLWLDLTIFGQFVKCPVYFILGNHSYWFSSFEKTYEKVNNLCNKYSNLIWLENSDVISLNSDTAMVGGEGWYDVRIGYPGFVKYTFDWFLIKEFRELSSMEERISKFREISAKNADLVCLKLEEAFKTHNTAYLMHHYPPWEEAIRHPNFVSKAFWTPYNNDIYLGKRLEHLMKLHSDKQLIVLSGHVHSSQDVTISSNITCRVKANGLDPRIICL